MCLDVEEPATSLLMSPPAAVPSADEADGESRPYTSEADVSDEEDMDSISGDAHKCDHNCGRVIKT